MPIELTDIIVPIVARRRGDAGVVDHYCTMCDEVVGYDHHFQAEPHRLDECLRQLKEKLEEYQPCKP